MEFLNEEEAEEAKKKLEQEMLVDPLDDAKDFISTDINWRSDVKTWRQAKYMALDAMTNSLERRSIFIAHDYDTIKGKPQLIHQSFRNITLMKDVHKKDKEGNDSRVWKFLDDGFDRRYDGYINYEWSKDFLIYKVVSEDKVYYVLTTERLPLQGCELKGMIVEMKDFTDLSKNMKMKGFSNVFFLKSFIPDIKILSDEDIVEFTKDREITEEKWFKYLGTHELGTMNRFPKEVEVLRSAFLLSSKVDGYPLHLGIIGPAGTRKSMGHIETIAWKFSEEPDIIEGGNSRIKGLSPSFKEKPCNIGYLARCERMGWVDELGKMVEFEKEKHQGVGSDNVLGQLNFLLDHKRRLVGSGNDNEAIIQAIAKFIFVTNPVSGASSIQKHVGMIDPTTMSRILWWVQNPEEQQYVLGLKGVIPPTPEQDYKTGEGKGRVKVRLGVGGDYMNSVSKIFDYMNREEFLTLYDTLNSFLTKINDEKVEEINNYLTTIAKEPMKSVWKPRGKHHIKLLIDGLCKHRCLFIDYDSSFEVKDEDYDEAKALLMKMVKNWDTDLSIKHEPDWSKGL